MELSKEEIADYKEEIQELTELLNTEWCDLKDTLSEELNLDHALLCSYFEDEDEGEHGMVLTKDKQFFQFSIQEGELEVTKVENIQDVEEEYPQVIVALQL